MASDTKKLAGECDLYNISLSAVGITIYIHKTIVCMLYSLLFIVQYNRIDYFFSEGRVDTGRTDVYDMLLCLRSSSHK